MHKLLFSLSLLAFLGAAGCSSTSESKSTGASAPANGDGFAYQKHKHIQKVWLAPGFDFTGYDTLLIGETKYTAKERPNEVEIRNWAISYLRTALADHVRTNQVFANVVTREADVKPEGKALRMDNTIFEYEKGGGGARYFAGLYGAGQPVLKVRGEFLDGGKPLCRFEASRSGESVGARMVGAFLSDKDIQQKDINDLAVDMSDFILRTSKHLPTR